MKLPSDEDMMEELNHEISFTTDVLKQGLDKVFRYNYVNLDPTTYADSLRELVNNSGVVKYERDKGFDLWKEAEDSYFQAFTKGDYLSFKNQDYEKKYSYAVKMYKSMAPNSKYF